MSIYLGDSPDPWGEIATSNVRSKFNYRLFKISPDKKKYIYIEICARQKEVWQILQANKRENRISIRYVSLKT